MKAQARFIGSLLLFGVLMLASCIREASDAGSSGDRVSVRFSVSGGSRESSSPVRGLHSVESQTVDVRVPGSDLYLSATLAATASPVRDGNTQSLVAGAKVWVGAYSGSPSAGAPPVASAVYSVSSGGALVAEAGELSVPAGVYTFTAWSCNSSGALTAENIDPTTAAGRNLMWGSASAGISEESPGVSLRLYHKFPELSVTVTTAGYTGTPAITSVAGGSITPGNAVSLNVADGTLTPGNAVSQSISGWTGASATSTQVQSSPVTVYTGNPFTVHIGSITIGATTYSDAAAFAFPFAMNLDGGASYTLTVNLKKLIKFAASNIYWDATAQRLTFDPYTTTSSTANMRKQGIMFKWGSLVGVSNPGTAGQQSTAWNANSAVYIPTDNTGTAWSSTTATAQGWTDWDGIPYLNDGYTSASSTDSHLTDLTADYSAFTGDICQFINSAYRMPTVSEFGKNFDYNTGQVGSTHLATEADGQTTLASGAIYALSSGMFFPASGYRNTVGVVYNIGTSGYYWSSSASSLSSYAGSMSFISGGADASYSIRRYGFAVRCVLK
ncbi:MAG: fimbrillin family protein [Dysgonamonadaceae bacterium]|jgi:hypothetical protein|nr:fimbrillin family protein [Dysgonamonadaceae bacterium]